VIESANGDNEKDFNESQDSVARALVAVTIAASQATATDFDIRTAREVCT
jgi:hypothetical protein